MTQTVKSRIDLNRSENITAIPKIVVTLLCLASPALFVKLLDPRSTVSVEEQP